MSIPLLVPSPTNEGQIANTESYGIRTLIYPKNGSTRGSSISTATGTVPAYGQMFPYQVNMVRAVNQAPNISTGVFAYTRSAAAPSIADFLARFATHLNRYHTELSVGSTATTLNVFMDLHGYTPTVTLNANGLSLVVSSTTAALPPRPIFPGTLVGAASAGIPGYSEQVAALPGSALITNPGNARFGVVIDSPTNETRMWSSDDVVLNVMYEGTVWMRLYGTAPIAPATGALELGLLPNANAGRLSVSGLGIPAEVVAIPIGGAGGYSSNPRYQPLDINVPVGGMFRLRVNS